MSVLLFSDFHLDSYRRFASISDTGLNSRVMAQVDVIDKVCLVAQENKVEEIIFLGDWFNGQGENLPKLIYHTAHQLLQQLGDQSHVYMLSGNHDIYRHINLLNSFQSRNIDVVTRTTKAKFCRKDITLVPWGGEIPPEGDVLFGHLGIIGASVSRWNTRCNIGDTQLSQVSRYNQVLLGHFHTQQKVGEHAYYIGAVMQNGFDDMGNEGGCVLWDGTEAEFVPIQSPTFNKVIIDFQGDINKFKKNRTPDDYYTLVVRTTDIDPFEFDHKIQVEYDIESKMETRLEQADNEPLEQTVFNFIDQVNTAVDKDRAKKYIEGVFSDV